MSKALLVTGCGCSRLTEIPREGGSPPPLIQVPMPTKNPASFENLLHLPQNHILQTRSFAFDGRLQRVPSQILIYQERVGHDDPFDAPYKKLVENLKHWCVQHKGRSVHTGDLLAFLEDGNAQLMEPRY